MNPAPAQSTTGNPPTPPRENLLLQRTFLLDLREGLHARPAAMLVGIAHRFACNILVEKGPARANARSILGLMGLAAGYGSQLRFTITGRDAARAMDACQRLFENHFRTNRSVILNSVDGGENYRPLRFLRPEFRDGASRG
jgi:phosphotransferase system HPr (HPr) family protein